VSRSVEWIMVCAVLALGTVLVIRGPDTGLQHGATGTVQPPPAASQPLQAERPPQPETVPAAGDGGRAAGSRAVPESPDVARSGRDRADPFGPVSYEAVGSHPYESYDSETLALLAYSDAKAAEVLGMRFRRQDEARSLEYILRAAALSGRPEALQVFRNASPYPVAIDGRPLARALREQYVLSVVADKLGAGPADVVLWEQRIRTELPNPDQEIRRLRRQAAELLRRMQEVQREVIGAPTIGGLDNA